MATLKAGLCSTISTRPGRYSCRSPTTDHNNNNNNNMMTTYHRPHHPLNTSALQVCMMRCDIVMRLTCVSHGTYTNTSVLRPSGLCSALSGTTTSLDFTEARDSEWQWRQLGHMQICTWPQTDNHASIPPLSFLQAGCPFCHPTNSVKALKALCATWNHKMNTNEGKRN